MAARQSIERAPNDVPEFGPQGSQLLLSNIFSNSSKYADLILTYNGHEWKVHKVIVCLQSDVFAKACDGQFQEAHSDTINLDHDDRECIEAMIQYMYTFSYNEDPIDSSCCPIIFNTRVYAIADKYNLPGLCMLATQKFENRVRSEWQTPEFAHVIREIYEDGAAEALVEPVLRIASLHAKDIYTNEFGRFFRAAVQDLPEFSSALSQKLATTLYTLDNHPTRANQ
ncbi:hypothetical protein LTR08_003726 [Meristemomyces frigidus]|nr:hypothetical protein LTR08_003726 [Meristemomyces frigidus]